jgi:hypothetical protein
VGYLEGVATGKAPPQIVCVGWPGVLPSPLTISVATPGTLGTAVLALDGVATFTTAPSDATYGRSLSAVTGYGQVAALNLGNGNGLTLFLPAGIYDASNAWTFDFGVGASPGPLIAVGLAPQDSPAAGADAPYQLTDSVLFRMHTLGANSVTAVRLPANPWDGMVVAIMDADGNSATANGAIIISGDGVNLQNPYNLNTKALLATIVIPYQTVEWTWDASAGFWRVTRDTASGELPAYPVPTLGPFVLGGRAFLKCATPTGTTAIHLPANPTEGMRVRIKDTVGNGASDHILITAPATFGIQTDPSLNSLSDLEVVAGTTGVTIAASFGCIDLAFDATTVTAPYTAGVWWVVQEYLP